MQNLPGDENRTDDSTNDNEKKDDLQGSKSDPQLTELEGLKQGGREPLVHEKDKARDSEGNID